MGDVAIILKSTISEHMLRFWVDDNFLWNCSHLNSRDLFCDKSTLIQVMGFGVVREEVINWSIVDPDLCRYMASLGHNVIIKETPTKH